MFLFDVRNMNFVYFYILKFDNHIEYCEAEKGCLGNMMKTSRNRKRLIGILLGIIIFAAMFNFQNIETQAAVLPGAFLPINLVDQTPLNPLTNPTAGTFNSRYLSGVGLDDTFTVLFEDRDASSTISLVSTTSGPTGFPTSFSTTNISDTHFVVKEWPYLYQDTWHTYRGWGAVGNNPNHNFYVSNDLLTWTLVSTFTIPNASGFSPSGSVYYGFHDVIIINDTFYAWAESNTGETLFVRSDWGGDVWEAFDRVGGNGDTDGPLLTPSSGVSPTPTGSFFALAFDSGYGKIYVPGDDSGIYLAINLVAKPSQDLATLEANFIDPLNWTWHDGSTGRLTPAHALLYQTAEHDFREAWLVPHSNDYDPWVIMYTADYSGTRALGYAMTESPCPPGFLCQILPIILK
jgi:hypothetical protein